MRPLDAARPQRLAARDGGLDARGNCADVERIDEHGGVTRNLRRGSARGGDDGGPARHRLEHREAEAFVQGRIDNAERTAVLTCELVVVDRSEPGDVRSARLDPTPAGRADDAQVDADPCSRLDGASEILPRLERADRQDVVSVGTRPVGR